MSVGGVVSPCLVQKVASHIGKHCYFNALSRKLCSAMASPVLSQKTSTFQVCHIDSSGEVANYEVPKVTFCNELGLSARDLRFQHSHMLSARNSNMIIRIQKLKAVICQNALLMIDSSTSKLTTSRQSAEQERLEEFCENLPALLTGGKLHTMHLPFEYRILEAILSFSVNSMMAEIQELEPKITELLNTLTDPVNMDVDRSLVHILLQCNSNLNKFSTVVKEFCQMLTDLLEYEDDMKDLCISVEPNGHIDTSSLYTAYVFTPSHVNNSDVTDEHLQSISKKHKHSKFRINLLDEMELLLDFFLREGEEIANKVSELKQAIDDSNSAILINLDSHRNMLLKFELQLTMGMFACTYFGLIGIAFGMNLDSSFEENPMAFWIATGAMFFGSGVGWLYLLAYMRRKPEKPLKPKEVNVSSAQNRLLDKNIFKPTVTSIRKFCSSHRNVLKCLK